MQMHMDTVRGRVNPPGPAVFAIGTAKQGVASQNIENNPMQSSGRPRHTPTRRLDASGKSAVFFHYSEIVAAAYCAFNSLIVAAPVAASS